MTLLHTLFNWDPHQLDALGRIHFVHNLPARQLKYTVSKNMSRRLANSLIKVYNGMLFWLRVCTVERLLSFMSYFLYTQIFSLHLHEQEAQLARTEQRVRRGYPVYLIKFFRYLPKCKLKRVYSQPCNRSNTAAPSVESWENDNELYMWSQWIAKWIYIAQVPVNNAFVLGNLCEYRHKWYMAKN